MKAYPSIAGASQDELKEVLGASCIAFYKYDGSNLRAAWDKKRGWWQFGSRHRVITRAEPVLGEGIELFLQTYGDPLERLLRTHPRLARREEAVAYFEFFGAKSFAGQHEEGDPKQVVLFDLSVHRLGLLGPREFLEVAGGLGVARVVYEGPLTPGFVEAVRGDTFLLQEGVICKGGEGHGRWARKIKTLAYLDALRQRFGERWAEFWE